MVDIAGVISELMRSNYDGYLLIEYQWENDPRDAAAENVRYLRTILNAARHGAFVEPATAN